MPAMKKLYVLAALLMVSTSAHAGNAISFEIGGHKIHVEAPKNCDSLSCLKISAPDFKDLKSKHSDDDDVAPRNDTPAVKPAPAPATQAAVAPPAPVAAASKPPAASTVASASPAPVAAPVTTAAPQPTAAAPAAAPTTPVGVWSTEENKGDIRVESCGTNLCGVAVNTGEKILINMKPVDNKWTGRIHDPDANKNYDATIAMKGPNTMKVQGCAFGGLFCGGQTWKRVS
jgi:uncharacterized protein (DUF2147 family)